MNSNKRFNSTERVAGDSGEHTRPACWSPRHAETNFFRRGIQCARTNFFARVSKCVSAGRRNQHAGRVCSPELAALALALFVGATAHAQEILGYTEPYKIITVSASEPGVLAELLVEEGVKVKKNQVLARLDVAALSAELEIAKAEAQLQSTRKQRLAELAQSSRATADELDKAKTDLVIKEAQVRKTEAMIESRTMRSPVDGVVTEIKRDPSESVSVANPHVLTVVQIDKLTVNLFLPPERARQLTVGASAHLRIEDEAEAAPATIEFINPVTDSASGTVRVKFAIENAAGKHRAGARCTLAGERVTAR